MPLKSLVVELSKAPFDPELNFAVALEYERLNQTASAVSFYLRCAEYGEGVLVYNSLLKMAKCFENQTGREYSVTNCILQAIAYDDTRPEAYLLLSQFHEKAGNWQEAYTFASIGLGWHWNADPLPAGIGYYGDYCLKFQMAVAAWWIGRKDESIATLNELFKMELDPIYANAVKYNLEKLHALL
jgi:hypothetical protein